MINDIDDELNGFKYHLCTFDKNTRKVIYSVFFREDKYSDAKKEYDNQIALHHNVDNDRVTITLKDYDTSNLLEEYDTDFDCT